MVIKDKNLNNIEKFNKSSILFNVESLRSDASLLKESLSKIFERVDRKSNSLIFQEQDEAKGSIALVSNINSRVPKMVNAVKPIFVNIVKCINYTSIADDEEDAIEHIDVHGNTRYELTRVAPNLKYFYNNNISVGFSTPISMAETPNGTEYLYSIKNYLTGLVLPPSMNLIEVEVFDLTPQKVNDIIDNSSSISSSIDSYIKSYGAFFNNIKKLMDDREAEYKSILDSISVSIAEKNRLDEQNSKTVEFLNRVNDEVKNSHEELSTLQTSVSSYSLEEEEMKKRLSLLSSDIQANSEALSKHKKEIVDSDTKLTSLKAKITDAEKDLNLYTFDMHGFDKESKFQLKKYYIGVCILLSMLFIIFGIMYFNAKSFSDLMDTSWKISTWDILLSRLPLFTATALIIGTFSALLFFLVNHIIALNTDKMNMLKASILAEQITGTLGCEQTMTPEQVVELKRNTKIELLLKVFSPKESTKISNTSEQVDVLAKLLDILKPKS
ncbi:hypothetical protein KO533_11740 [Shewanella sp. NKUCC05_KAH]|uniref:hypothetical protein n=1 Tax=Shewanella sp. NKUCC05_KAH TaxID=2842126 RepID=UPI001C5A871E|nr:hypothetical protein [Shewanella sp. NKUCC05_KAH]MBW3527232.1 hypothetical protein [Shewanella sp. NKUCC05_KAH]